MLLSNLWYLACTSRDLPRGKMKRQEICGAPVVLARGSDGHVFAMRDICPHRAAPLSAGRLIEDGGEARIECPYHGWTFGPDSACREIPSCVEGQNIEPGRIKAGHYPVHEHQGLIWVYVPENLRQGAGPVVPPPQFDMAPGLPKLVLHDSFACHIDHAVVGLMDPAHGPYVHQQWWWRSRKQQLVKEKAFGPRERGFAMEPHSPSKNSRAYAILGGKPVTEITFQLPGLRWEHIRVGDKTVLALTCLTPVHDQQTDITQIFYWDLPILSAIKPLLAKGARAFLAQDGEMVNLQQLGLKHDPNLIWIDDADTQAKWYHQLKKAWAASVANQTPFENPVKPATLRWRS